MTSYGGITRTWTCDGCGKVSPTRECRNSQSPRMTFWYVLKGPGISGGHLVNEGTDQERGFYSAAALCSPACVVKVAAVMISSDQDRRGVPLPCPFCNQNEHLVLECKVLGEEEIENWTVWCDAAAGGCGASTGSRRTGKSAWVSWNTRLGLQ